ncbi:DinB family protein [Halostreptopolyspora alba]|uniref:DinB family protein n=1 Tax=Halostreptopolyspora alba TaxID=2487137 RepID=A0A3N0EEX7_9ACTN|nr:DinB family protein [Nocardiopsaceae bacterium YIM 96095]
MAPSSEHSPSAGTLDLAAATQGAATATTKDERTVLTAFLDYERASVVAKVSGLGEQEARRRLVPSLTTPAGILRHLTIVERNWFRSVLRGEPAEELGMPSSGTEESWELPDGATAASLVTEYERTCAHSREIAARLPLDHVVAQHELGEVSLRWILTHMIQETARHAGHADILREQLDGTTGIF